MLLLNFKTNRIIYSQLQVVEVGQLFLSEAKLTCYILTLLTKLNRGDRVSLSQILPVEDLGSNDAIM